MKKLLLLLILVTSSLLISAQEIRMEHSNLYVDGERVGYLNIATRNINKENPHLSNFHYVFVIEKKISGKTRRSILNKIKKSRIDTKVEYVEIYRKNKIRTTIAYATSPM